MSTQSTAGMVAAHPRPLDSPLTRRRRRLLLNLGCLPATLLLTAGLLLVLNALAFWNAPSWVTDPWSYLVTGRLLLSLVVPLGLQLVLTWIVNLAAAAMSARAVAGQGGLLIRRLGVIRRRLAIAAWAIVVIRLVVVLAAIFALAYLYTDIFGFHLISDFAEDAGLFVSRHTLITGCVVVIIVGQWLGGPLLRLRHSLALGSIAGTWARHSDLRPWLALAVRLGASLAGMMLLIWGVVMTQMVLETLINPSANYPLTSDYLRLFPRLPPRPATVGTVGIVVSLILGLHTAVQVGLPPIILAAVRKRMGRPKQPDYFEVTSADFRELAKKKIS